MFHPAPTSTQEDIGQLALRVSKRILRFLQRHGVITLVTAPGDGEVTVGFGHPADDTCQTPTLEAASICLRPFTNWPP
jgi:hypothetical protein